MKGANRSSPDNTSRLRSQAALARWALVFGLASVCWSQQYQRHVGVSWDFGNASDPLGWSPIVSLSNFGVQNGALTFTATAQAYIIFSPWISIPTAAMQRVEIVMRSDTAGTSKVFWAPAQTGIYGGFQGGDENDFVMIGDGAFHHYYLPIDTSSATTIYRVRLDVPPRATVSIQSVALANLTAPGGPGMSPLWQFTVDGDTQGWIPYSGVMDISVSGGRLHLHTLTNATILAPKAQVTNQLEWFSLFASVTQTSLETPWIQFAFLSAAGSPDQNKAYFPLVPDSADHVYNQNVGGVGGWWSTASQLSIIVSENTTVAIGQIQVSEAPQGPADVGVEALGPATPLIRAGSPFQVSCRVLNRGSQPVQQLAVKLNLPGDGSVKVMSSPSVPESLVNGYPQTLVWTLSASQTGNLPISVTATSQGGGSMNASATILVNPSVTAPSSPYAPVPVPAQSNYDVGIFYFPGWRLDSHWDPIREFPERMPVLGYYAEGAPQVIDWQIKWAAEHGIRFFLVDWEWYSRIPYLLPGEQRNNFLEAYFKSAYRSYVNFGLAYSTNSPSTTAASTAEFLTIAQTWISEYFSKPEYYTIGGAPVVFIIDPPALDANLGGSAKQALEAARQLARGAGFSGIYFIANSGFGNDSPAGVKRLSADGYDAISSYGSGNVAGVSDPDEAPYSLMVTANQELWDSLMAASTVPFIIPVGSDWDPRPDRPSLYGGGYEFTRTGSTAALYETLLQGAKNRIDAGKAPRIVMVDNWTERGEGHWIEPSAGIGFSYLDAVRRVFVGDSPHADLVPADIGLPLVQTVRSTALWTFTESSDLEPWRPDQGAPGLTWAYQISNSVVTGKQWTFTSTGNADLVRMGFEISAQDYSALAIRMSASSDVWVSVGWGAVDEPGVSALRSAGFLAKVGPMQTYIVQLAGKSGWRGLVNVLRLTMSNSANVAVAIESIQFIPSSTAVSMVSSKTQVQFTSTINASAPALQTVSVASATGTSLSWTATTNASWLALSAANGTAPANIAVSVNPAGLAVGVYSAAITIAAAGAGNSPLAIPVTLWVMPAAVTPPTPSIAAVVNGADFKSEAFSAGAWISIFGQNLGLAATWTTANTVTLGGASVSVCGLPAVLYYNSGPVTTNGSTGWQLNALTPDGVAGQTSCPVIVTVAGRASQPVSVAIASGVMEVFGFTSSAGPLPIITHADYSLVGPATAGLTPAKPNETVIAWGTGDCSTPSVSVSGTSATVAFSGRVGPGLCQLNFVVPGAPMGSNQLNVSTSPNLYSLWVSL